MRRIGDLQFDGRKLEVIGECDQRLIERRVDMGMGADQFLARQLALADLEKRNRARHLRVLDQRAEGCGIEIGFDPVDAEIAAELARRQQPVKGRACIGREFEHRRDMLRLAVGEIRTRRPEAAGRARPFIGRA